MARLKHRRAQRHYPDQVAKDQRPWVLTPEEWQLGKDSCPYIKCKITEEQRLRFEKDLT